jgi:CRP-like cAMP-binding protein
MPNADTDNRAVLFPVRPLPGSWLFDGLDPDRLKILHEAHGPQRRAEARAHLVRAADPNPPVVTLSTGWAFRYVQLVDGRRQILSVGLPGDTIGLDTLVGGGPVYPVQTGRGAVYSEMAHTVATSLVRDADWFRDRAVKALARDRADAERALIRMGQCTAEAGVASVLLELYDRLARCGLAAGHQFKLELTQEQFADLVGMTPFHLNRTLTRLRSRDLVSIAGDLVTLLNVPDLEQVAVLPPGFK